METNDKESNNEILETPPKTIFTTIKRNNDDTEDTEDYSDDYESIHLNFPAISPVSNISASSGFISCGSSSSSKPTTPTNLLTDKHCCGNEDYDDCIPNSTTTTTTHDNINNNSNSNKPSAINNNNDEIIRDNENGQLAININNNNNNHHHELQQRRNYTDIDTEESDDKSSKLLSSPIPSCSKGVKSRSKYRNNSSSSSTSSSSDHHSQPSSRYRQSKKHISLDDEIVIYESDSSLIESRRRLTSNSHYSNCNRINFQNHQGRTSTNAALISRHKSEENPPTQPSNQIVSILKRKDSSGKESPCLVTFSPNVKDNNFESSNRASTSMSSHRQGILKKRSSLDESSRRFRSHSPSSESEKGGCLVKDDRRRNSCEEIHHQGILKQKSYESSTGYSSSGTRSSGLTTPNSGVQGILKKPSLTPSDHSSDHSTTKHVSISEAVILAAAELCKDMIIDDSHEPYIKPILKLDNEHHYGHERKPKPILKKNHSSENEEIRSILKSRKSSREEPDDL